MRTILLLLTLFVIGCTTATVEPVVVERETTSPKEEATVPVDVVMTPEPTLPFVADSGYPAPQNQADQSSETPPLPNPTTVPSAYVPQPTYTPYPTPVPPPTAVPFAGPLPTDVIFLNQVGELWHLREDVTKVLLEDVGKVTYYDYHHATGVLAYSTSSQEGVPAKVYLQTAVTAPPTPIFELSNPVEYPWGGEKRITSVVFSSDGLQLAISLTDAIYLYDVTVGTMELLFENPIIWDETAEYPDVGKVRSYSFDSFALNDQQLLGYIGYWEGREPILFDIESGTLQSVGEGCYGGCAYTLVGQMAQQQWVVDYHWEPIFDDDDQFVEERNQLVVSDAEQLLLPREERTVLYTFDLEAGQPSHTKVYGDYVYITYFEHPTKENRHNLARRLVRWHPATGEQTVLFDGHSSVDSAGLRIVPDANGEPHFFLEGYANSGALYYFDLAGQQIVQLNDEF